MESIYNQKTNKYRFSVERLPRKRALIQYIIAYIE